MRPLSRRKPMTLLGFSVTPQPFLETHFMAGHPSSCTPLLPLSCCPLSPCRPVPSCSPVTVLSPSILQPCHHAVTLHPAALALLSGLSPNCFAQAVQQLLVTSSLSSSPGDIGGQMGLFIGASILTILEILDYIYEVL